MTFYQYDDQGRLVRSIQQPEWTAEDRALMLARAMYLRTLCPGICGQPKELAWSPHNEGWYEAGEEHVCHACTSLQNHGRKPDEQAPVVFLDLDYTRDHATHPLPAPGAAPVQVVDPYDD